MKCPFCKEPCGNEHCSYDQNSKDDEIQTWVKGHYFVVIKVSKFDENHEIIICNYWNENKTISKMELIKGQWENLC